RQTIFRQTIFRQTIFRQTIFRQTIFRQTIFRQTKNQMGLEKSESSFSIVTFRAGML
ncbi:MAG: pentapeptide repeat-containing protein, partial [Deltaproteobacteria bacterium]|nr:pentapeptide repeat-containing protein [Deltaproteobacteria bacterium]